MPDTVLGTGNKCNLHKEKSLSSWSVHCSKYRPADNDTYREKSRKSDRKFRLEGRSIINKSDSL